MPKLLIISLDGMELRHLVTFMLGISIEMKHLTIYCINFLSVGQKASTYNFVIKYSEQTNLLENYQK